MREFVSTAFAHLGMELDWQGSGVDEIGIERKSGKVLVRVNPKFFRPAEVELLLGDPARAEKVLGWRREISFTELVQRMVENDYALVQQEMKVSALKD